MPGILGAGRTRLSITIDNEDLAKLRQLCSTTRVKEKGVEREMRLSDFFDDMVHKAVAKVTLNDWWRQWMESNRAKVDMRREAALAKNRAGAYRIPPELQRKRGRVAGKHYEKIDAAMAALGAKRRAAREAAKGVKTKEGTPPTRKRGRKGKKDEQDNSKAQHGGRA